MGELWTELESISIYPLRYHLSLYFANILAKNKMNCNAHNLKFTVYLAAAALVTGLNGVADEGTGNEYVLIFWISLRLTFSSKPRWTAKFFRLVNKLSSDWVRFDLSSKYLRAFLTIAARLALAFSAASSGFSSFSDTIACKMKKRYNDKGLVRNLILNQNVFRVPGKLLTASLSVLHWANTVTSQF